MVKKTVVAKKPVVKKAVSKKTPAPKMGLAVVIDYPEEHAVILPGHYAVRLTAAGATQAQLRFDGGEWFDCRESLGHFWYDWAPQSGRVRLASRARTGKGRWTPTAERDIVVKPNEVSLVG